MVRPTVKAVPSSRQLACNTSSTVIPRAAAKEAAVSPASTTTRTHHCGGPHGVTSVATSVGSELVGEASAELPGALSVWLSSGVGVARASSGAALAAVAVSAAIPSMPTPTSAVSSPGMVITGVGGTRFCWLVLVPTCVSNPDSARLTCQLCQARKARTSTATRINSELKLTWERLGGAG
jgi:hypothetical protein